MLYWWFFFQKAAEGLPQMALSFGMFLIGLLLVGGATALHLGAVNAQTFGEDAPAKLITVAVLLNLVSKTFMPILDPETMLKAKQKASQGKITALAFKRLDAKVDDLAEDLADKLSGDMLAELEQAALATRRRPNPIEGQAHPPSAVARPATVPHPNGRPAPVEQTAPPGPDPQGQRRTPPPDPENWIWDKDALGSFWTPIDDPRHDIGHQRGWATTDGERPAPLPGNTRPTQRP
jgi:hypothetical protein